MTDSDDSLSRRALIKGAGLGLGAVVAAAPASAQPAKGIWSAEYRANKGTVSLYLYRKRAGAPAAGEAPRPVLFLVHGSSVSARAWVTVLPLAALWPRQ